MNLATGATVLFFGSVGAETDAVVAHGVRLERAAPRH